MKGQNLFLKPNSFDSDNNNELFNDRQLSSCYYCYFDRLTLSQHPCLCSLDGRVKVSTSVLSPSGVDFHLTTLVHVYLMISLQIPFSTL